MNFSWKHIKKSIGPGVTTGIADDDPSGIATYAQTGAIFGLHQLWLALYSLPLMIAVQEMCARIGMVTGKGIAGVIKSHYPKVLLLIAVSLLGLANIVNIGADLGAMGIAASFISPFSPGIALIIITLFTICMAVLIPYPLYARILKYFAASVLAYVVTAFFLHHDWKTIALATFIPHIEFTKDFLLNITAFLGTTISPYLFFWEADQEVEEEVERKKLTSFGKGKPKITKGDFIQMRNDTCVGMFLSNLVAFFIVITASQTMSVTGSFISATSLAEALRPIAGDFAVYIFSFGILGTGLLAVPVLAGSLAYAVAETFGIRASLGATFKDATGFYAVLIIATLVGVILNFSSLDPIKMLYYSAALNGILASPILIIIMMISNNKKILGKHVNGIWSNIFGGIATLCMGVISLITIISLVV